MFNPSTIAQAYSLAKIQELNLSKTSNKPTTKFNNTPSLTSTKPGILPTPLKNSNIPPKPITAPFKPNPNRRTLLPAEFEERRSKGLCFFCNEKYEYGHRCKGKRPQLYHMEWDDLDEDADDEATHEADNEFSQISVNAMAGITEYQTMRVTGYYRKRALQMLLDTASTHNFMDIAVAKKLGCKLVSKPPMLVRVADGGRVMCDTMIEGFQWKIQSMSFTADLYLLPLGGCDVVLGVQWFT